MTPIPAPIPLRRLARRAFPLVVASLALALPTWAQESGGTYDAQIRRTSYGIPHVKANDWGSLGYGYGYAFAQDNFCVLALDVVEANGQLSRYFGRADGNIESDWFRKYWTNDALVTAFRDSQQARFQEVVRGYAAGYNRFLRDTGVEALPEDCRNAEWVREIDELDLYRVYHKLLGRAGAGALPTAVVDAEPPPAPAAASGVSADRPVVVAEATEPRLEALRRAVEIRTDHFGSNMVAVGRKGSKNGRGILLVNPHFPWTGPLRFHQVHLTYPGKFDSMGAALFGSPVPNIAFNKDVAWSHTVSAARRFTLHQLELAPDDPTVYLVDGERRAMTATEVTVDVKRNDGSIVQRSHTFYESEYGPIVSISVLLWGTNAAFALQDVNRENFRIFNQYFEMNRARSVGDVVKALKENLGLPWVNTAVTDRFGGAYYGDISAVPHLSNDKLEECATDVSGLVAGLGIFLVDGSRSECQLGIDDDAPAPYIFGPKNLPGLRRRDYVQNSNDSYWLANPKKPLEGFAEILGGERIRQGLRTRLGVIQARERLAGTDGLGGRGYTARRMRQIFYGNRNLSAEMMADGLLTLCDEESNSVDVDGGTVDVGPACTVLAGWDRTQNTESVGAAVWREFWSRADDIPDLYAVPFDPDDPIDTPRDLNLANTAVRTAAMEALARAVERLEELGVALDASWGEAHFDTRRDGEEIPISGGPGSHGIYNAISSRTTAGKGYTPMTSGSSIVQVVTWGKKGPKVEAVLSYSQSTDPESPHFSDQTRVFSDSQWVRLPFTDRQIRKDPGFEMIELTEARPLP